MNIIVFGDIHIKKSELAECSLVLDEIVSLCNKYHVDQVIDLGDTFDTLRPESECLDLFAKFVKKLERPITIISANSHESSTSEESIVNHFGILSEGVKVVKEYIDESYLFAGHFFLNESNVNYGASRNAEEFKKYKYVFLGHQHTLQAIGKNIMHLGASRHIDFAETQDKAKVILLIEDYKSDTEKNHIIALKTPYPMREVYLDPKGGKAPQNSSVAHSEEEFKAILDKIAPKTKVRVIFKDFHSYTQVIPILINYKTKFVVFKEKKDFIISDNTLIGAKTETVNLKQSLMKYLESNKIPNEIKNILLEELK